MKRVVLSVMLVDLLSVRDYKLYKDRIYRSGLVKIDRIYL